ncbi:hypothetical protein DF186_19605, partial [Enterococcus hirae]
PARAGEQAVEQRLRLGRGDGGETPGPRVAKVGERPAADHAVERQDQHPGEHAQQARPLPVRAAPLVARERGHGVHRVASSAPADE